MRINVTVDDELMANAMRVGEFTSKREAVEEALRLLVRRKTYDGLLALRGKLHWAGDDSVDWSKIPADEPSPALSEIQDAAFSASFTSTPSVRHRRTEKR